MVLLLRLLQRSSSSVTSSIFHELSNALEAGRPIFTAAPPFAPDGVTEKELLFGAVVVCGACQIHTYSPGWMVSKECCMVRSISLRVGADKGSRR